MLRRLPVRTTPDGGGTALVGPPPALLARILAEAGMERTVGEAQVRRRQCACGTKTAIAPAAGVHRWREEGRLGAAWYPRAPEARVGISSAGEA
eukprot:9805190-Alexandrium_andersonii.AAC.1